MSPLRRALLAVALTAAATLWAPTRVSGTPSGDGHLRPRALAFNRDDGMLYVALSTSDEVAVVDPVAPVPRQVARVRACRFPDAIVARPSGGALVACRFEPGLRLVAREGQGAWRARVVAADVAAGGRGLALAPGGAAVYVASPPAGGIEVVSLAGGVVQRLATGLSPRGLRVVPAGVLPGVGGPLLLVSNFIDHAVTVHPIGADGRLGEPLQTLRTEAPVLDLLVVGSGPDAALLLFTHEDRALSRARGPVEGLDSVVLRLGAGRGSAPFDDPGPGRRRAINLGERAEPVIELASACVATDGDAVAVVGAGSDNLLAFGSTLDGDGRLASAGRTAPVGANPAAVAALPGGAFVTADRLSDTLTFVTRARATTTLALARGERNTPSARGEALFYSRALVPNNVADGPLSLYTCAACHDDGHVDGRRHPAKRNRFFSMTETCRGLGTTAPYLSLGDPATIDAFADNIVATHAQGAERDAKGFDRYPVDLRLRRGGGWTRVTLSPAEVRAALAAYMASIPPEPSPFAAVGARALEAEQRRGLELFRAGCTGCHQLVGDSARGNKIPARALERRLLAGEVALTSPGRHAVGTPILGAGGNNPPSLRGVWDGAPYFSDGSARSLDDVLRRTNPDAPTVHAPENAAKPAFTEDQRRALIAFLKAL